MACLMQNLENTQKLTMDLDMRPALRLVSLASALFFSIHAHSAVIPIGLDITGNIGNTFDEGNGTLDVTMETLGLTVNSTTDIDGSLGSLVTVGDDPIDVVSRFENTGSGFGFDGLFASTMGSTDVEFGDESITISKENIPNRFHRA